MGMVPGSTIFALSSAPGRAAVAVIRVSGPHAAEVLRSLAGKVPEPRKAALRTLRHPSSGERLDQALVLYFEGPHSETGEDTAELQVHGGKAVIAAVFAALGSIPGCRIAEPGEFARRAFANGKLDLTQAEGLADLIDAETDAQRRQALTQAAGSLSRLYEGWRQRLIEATALVEAAIDFSDEADVSDKAVGQAEAAASRLAAELSAHLADGHRGEILREGFRIVLAGPPNVGKSSLLNALARREAAIVSEEAGTTRDVIEVRLDLEGLPAMISDTAGIRRPTSAVEREGIRRTMERARAADLVIWLVDSTGPQWEVPAEITGGDAPILVVLNKVDLGRSFGRAAVAGAGRLGPATAEPGTSDIEISALTGQGLAELTSHLAALAAARIGAAGEAPVITQTRHRHHVGRAAEALHVFLSGAPSDLELRAEELRIAAAALGRVTGRIDIEDVLDQIFSRFCIGK